MTPRPIIIDCDPGIDDAVALFLAFAAPDILDVQAITTVAGNVPLDLTARNARLICALAGRDDVPIHAGCPRPIWREPVTAEDFHGETGLDGIDLFEPGTPLADGHAVTLLVEAIRARQTPVTLVITGPMTNIAMALIQAPDILEQIDEMIVMGGADAEGGNITPHAEFNIFADPHAADIVFKSGAPISVLNLDVTHKIRINAAMVADMAALNTAIASHVASLLAATNRFEKKSTGALSGPLHDPSTIAFLLAPHLFEGQKAHVRVDTNPGETFGKTHVRYDPAGPVNWIQSANSEGVFSLLKQRFAVS